MMGFFQNFMDSMRGRRHPDRTPPPAEKRKTPPPAPPLPKAPPAFSAYSDEERRAVEHYIGDAFGGPIVRTFFDAGNDLPRLDVAVTEPLPGRSFYTLSTVGMGANAMTVPPELREHNRAFAELTVCLPPDWDLMRNTWPFRMLQETARLPFSRHDLIGVGNAYRGPMMKGSGFAAAMVLPAAVRGSVSTRLLLPSGKIVNFFLLLPLYEEEWREIVDSDSSFGFWERYARHGGSIVVDPERGRCTAEREEEEDEWSI